MQENPYGQSPAGAPPIPAPEGLAPLPVQVGGDWNSAPPIVKGWAHPLALLGMVGAGLIGIVRVMTSDSMPDKIGWLIFAVVLFGGMFWQRGALRRGASAAWGLQILFSAMGLTAFPVGTAIHGYILSQWFKPDVKAWFGQR